MAKRLFKIITLFLVLIVWPFMIGSANEATSDNRLWRELNQTTDSILRYVKEGHYEEAQQLLNQFSNQFLSIRASEYDLSMREMQVITSVYEEATEAAISVSMSHEDRVNRVYKLRLLVDVYESSYEPLWKNTKKSLFNPLSNMIDAVEEGDTNRFQREYSEFVEHYEMVRPGWSVSLPYELYQRIDSQVQYLHQLRADLQNKTTVSNHLEIIENQLSIIYDGKQDEVSDPSLIWVMITIGGAIVMSLSYAGWKKYRGEKEKDPHYNKVRKRIR